MSERGAVMVRSLGVTLAPKGMRRAGIGEDEPVLEFVASSEVVDRHGEIIRASGWVVGNFMKNPVFLNSHKHGDVSAVLGRVRNVWMGEVGGVLGIEVEFAVEVNPLAKMVHGLYRDGFLSAVSVGFRALEWDDEAGEDGRVRRVYTKQELLEVSAVTVPANPEALMVRAMERVRAEDVRRLWWAMRVDRLRELRGLMRPAGGR